MVDQRAREQQADSRARTHLANERTLLAWLRTSVALIGLGLGVAQFLSHNIVPGLPLTRSIAVAMVATGMFIALDGTSRYYRHVKEIDAGEFKASSRHLVAVVSWLFAIIGLLAIAFIILLGR